MARQSQTRLRVFVLAVAALTFPGVSRAPTPQRRSTPTMSRAVDPIRFEPNVGQWDPRIRFVARGGGPSVVITDDAMALTVRDVKITHEDDRRARVAAIERAKTATITMKLRGSRAITPAGEQELATRSNFFLGSDRAKWRTNVPNFGAVRAKNWRDGVDVVWHGGARGLEYDLEVAPGSDASKLVLEIEGATSLATTSDGALTIATAAGAIVEPAPAVFQGATRLPARFVLKGPNEVGFAMLGYTSSEPVLIDPTFSYSTYIGTGGDYAYGMAVDSSGNAYLVGMTGASNYPIVDAYETDRYSYDAFLSKLDVSGTALVYSTYFGGDTYDYAYGVAVDSSGSAYVVGQTNSYNLPVVNAYQKTFAGYNDAFVAKFSSSGSSLDYSTYLGGTGNDGAQAIAVDSVGAAYVVGWTLSSNFPMSNAYQAILSGGEDAFVTKVSPSGTALTYSTYVGGTGDDSAMGVAIDATGSAYVTGSSASTNFPVANAYQPTVAGQTDAFVTKLAASGATLAYSTLLGGSGADVANALAVDSKGSVWIGGTTSSKDFPTLNAYQGAFGATYTAFMAKLGSSGNSLLYSSYFGGSFTSGIRGVATDSSDDVYIAGVSASNDFPTACAYQTSQAGQGDAFVAKLESSGSPLMYSTLIGGTQADAAVGIGVDSSSGAIIYGQAASTNFPVTAGAYQTSVTFEGAEFVARFSDPAFALEPSSVQLPPKAARKFVACGGDAAGYVYSLQTNASGASIDATGQYTAGPKGNVVDVVQAVDATNAVVTAVVTIGPDVSIAPPSATLAPSALLKFAATGGSGTGYVWSLATNGSGAVVNPSTGVYVAGTLGSSTDVVHVSDSLGNTADATVSVGPAVTIVPAAPSVPPNGTVDFSASGGSNTGFAWQIAADKSGGTIDTTTGAYTAGPKGGVVDTVSVADSIGNMASVNVSVGGGLAINPASPKIAPNGGIAFTASGGSGGGYLWSLATNASGGAIDGATGKYKAGPVGNATDVVSVTDSLSNVATVDVLVLPLLSIDPPLATTSPGGHVHFSASGGNGGYAWSLAKNGTGATIDASGLYTAGPHPDTDTVRVTDSFGTSATATVVVGKSNLDDAGPDAGTLPTASGGCSCDLGGGSRLGMNAFVGLLACFSLIARRRARAQ